MILLLVTVVNVLGQLGWIPSLAESTAWLGGFLERYGVVVVLPLAILENLIVLNVYFPGSIVILTAMALTAGDPRRALVMFVCIVIGSTVGQNANYWMGRYGGSRGPAIAERQASRADPGADGSDRRTSRRWWLVFFGTFWHPHSASLTSILAGSEGLRYKQFLIYLLSTGLAWSVFWGFTMYHFGGILEARSNLLPAVYIYVVVWILYNLRRFVRKQQLQTRGV